MPSCISARAFCNPRSAHLNTSIYTFACKDAMAVIDAVPSLEELSLVDVCGQQCMPGIETNLAELLLTAAEATPDRVCLEVEGESYTFAQALLSQVMQEIREYFLPDAFSRKAPA